MKFRDIALNNGFQIKPKGNDVWRIEKSLYTLKNQERVCPKCKTALQHGDIRVPVSQRWPFSRFCTVLNAVNAMSTPVRSWMNYCWTICLPVHFPWTVSIYIGRPISEKNRKNCSVERKSGNNHTTCCGKRKVQFCNSMSALRTEVKKTIS